MIPPAPSPLARLGTVAPRCSRQIVSSPWGVQSADNEAGAPFGQAGDLGVKWTRFLASWPQVEGEPGAFAFAAVDAQIDGARGQDITPLVCLTGGHPHYSKALPHPDEAWRALYGVPPAPPILDDSAMAAWLCFVSAIVTHARGRVSHWEIWNEPNHQAYWGHTPDPVAYGRLVHRTAECIRAAQRDATVVAGALAGLDPAYIGGFLREDTARLVDVVSFHHYAALPEQRMYSADETWRVLGAHDPRLALWQTECGYPSHSSTKDFRGASPWGYRIQAKWLLRQALVDHYFLRAEVSMYFKLFDATAPAFESPASVPAALDRVLGRPAPANGGRVRRRGVNEKCLLRNPTLEPKPAFHAYRNLTALLDGRYRPVPLAERPQIAVLEGGQFAGIGDGDDAFPSVPLAAAYRTERGAALAVWWLPWQPQEFTPQPARIRLRALGLEFREPVLVDLLSGEVFALPPPGWDGTASIFDRLPLQDYPLAIAERDEVPLGSASVSNLTRLTCARTAPPT